MSDSGPIPPRPPAVDPVGRGRDEENDQPREPPLLHNARGTLTASGMRTDSRFGMFQISEKGTLGESEAETEAEGGRGRR